MIYHEYFVGGPMDGQTRGYGLPAQSAYEAFEYIDITDVPEYSPHEFSGGHVQIPFVTWLYRPRRIVVTGTNVILTVWTDSGKLTDDQAMTRLWEIILEPHKFIPDTPTERRTS